MRNEDHSIYFITITLIGWIDILTRPIYKDIIVDALKFYQQNKQLEIYGWVIMTNHVHLLVAAGGDTPLWEIIRDFKRFTNRAILSAIKNNPQESRAEWILYLLEHQRDKTATAESHQLWQKRYDAVQIVSNSFFDQKLNYIHENPVRQGFVQHAEDYPYSSAIDYCGGNGLLPVILG